MANDREAELKITTRLIGTDDAAEGLADLRGEIVKGGEAASEAAAAISSEAGAVGKLADASETAATKAAKASDAIRETGDAAEEAGKRTATASERIAEGLGQATTAAERLSAAEDRAGASGADAGADIAGAADKATSEIDQLTVAWGKETAAASKAGTAFDSDKAVASIRELVTAIRSTGDVETQRAALQKLADTVEAEFKAAAVAAKDFGGATAEQARFAREAMTLISAELEQVEASLASAGNVGASSFGEIKVAALTFESAAKNAINAVNDATKQYNDESRITPMQIARATQAVEALRIAQAEQGAVGEATIREQTALYAALENQLTELTLRSNALTNAGKDNAIRLRETGVQVQGLAMGVQQLTSMLGPQAAGIGMLVGNAGQLGGVYEGLKSNVGALNLNTLQLNASNAAAASQWGLLALAAGAGLTVGKELAETSSANREEIDRLKDSLKEFRDSVLNGAISRVGGMQDALQRMTVDVAEAYEAFRTLNVTAGMKGLSDLHTDTIGLGIAMERGSNAAKTYYALLNGGFESTEAMVAITQLATQATELHARAMAQGGNGINIWNDAVANSGGTAQGLARELSILPSLLDADAAATARSAEAKKAYAASASAAAHAVRLQTVEIYANMTAQQEANDAAARAASGSLTLEQAVNGTSEAVNILARSIASLVPESDKNTVALGQQASALADVLSKLDGLSKAERARINELKELAQRGDELTAAERKYAVELANAIVNGKAVSTATRDRIVALQELMEATNAASNADANANAVAGETIAATDAHTESILRQLDAVREQIAANLEAGQSVDFLRMKETQLVTEAEASLTVWSATNDAKAAEGDERAKLAAIIEKEKAANEGLVSSQQAIVKVQEEGRIVYKNVGEEVENTRIRVTALRDTTAATALGVIQSLTKMRQDAQAELLATTQAVDSLRDAIDKLNGTTKTLGTVAKEAAGGA